MKNLTMITIVILLNIYPGETPYILAQTWEFVGLDSMVIKHLYVSGDTIYAGTAVRSSANINSGLYFTSDGGNNWVQLDSALGSGIIVGVKYIREGELFLIKGLSEGSLAGNLYRTTNNGLSWNIINISGNGIRWIGSSPFNKNEIYALDRLSGIILINTLYKSTDGGNTWADISAFPSSSHGSALAFAFDLIDSMNLYVTVDTQFDQYLFKSTNKGENWFFVSSPPSWPVIYADNFIPTRIYLFPEPYVSNDGGLSWFLADSGLADTSYYLSFYQDEETTKLLYSLRRDGLYSSRNDSIHWSMVDGSEDLPIYFSPTGFYGDRDMCNIFIEPERKELFLGTAEGIYKIAIITNINEDDKRYLDFSLSQNYPNPFNPTTTIEYQIPSVGQDGILTNNVKLKVYDILGKEVAVLVNEVQAPGTYKIEFNGEGLTSGIYFYKFEAGSSSIVRKMLLLK